MRTLKCVKRSLLVLLFALFLCVIGGVLCLKTEKLTASASSDWTITEGDCTRTTGSYDNVETKVFSSEGAFRVYSDKKVWVDKFGLAFRLNAADNGNFKLIVSSNAEGWYQTTNGENIVLSFALQNATENVAKVTLEANGESILEYTSDMLSWTDNHSYSTNYVYLCKTDSGWVININEDTTALSETESAKLEAVYQTFENRIGYLQFENAGGAMTFTYISVLYGMPTSSIDPPEHFSTLILNAPDWTVTTGTEVAGWIPNYHRQYTVTSDLAMPLKGLDVTVRMAHAEEATQNIIAFTSLYQHNWYAGTYSLCLRFNYDPVYGDDSVSLQLMIYTPMTENNNEEPIKMAQIVDFHWFESNRIQLTKSRGEWVLSLNGTQLFAGQKSSEGKTLNDYLSQISPYFADGAYLQMFGCGNVAKGLALDDGIVIESAKALEKTSAVSVTVDTDKCAEITSIVYKTGVEVNVDLSEIFQVSGGTAEYFATLGAIEEGVWKYTSSTEGTAIVTVTAAVNGTSKDVTLQFHFERGAETALGSTSETTSGKQAGSGCKSACEGSFAVIACLIGAAVVLQKWHKKENER